MKYRNYEVMIPILPCYGLISTPDYLAGSFSTGLFRAVLPDISAIPDLLFLIAKRTLLKGEKPACLERFWLTISELRDGLDGQDKTQKITLQKSARIRDCKSDLRCPWGVGWLSGTGRALEDPCFYIGWCSMGEQEEGIEYLQGLVIVRIEIY